MFQSPERVLRPIGNIRTILTNSICINRYSAIMIRFLVLLVLGTIVHAGTPIWGSFVPDTVKKAVKPAKFTFKFTPRGGGYIKNEVITITASTAIFVVGTQNTEAVVRQSGILINAANPRNKCKIVHSVTTTAILKFTVTEASATCTWAFEKGKEVTIELADTALFAVNPAGTVTFTIASSTVDTGSASSMVGYTVPNVSLLFGTATIDTDVTSKTAAPDFMMIKFTPNLALNFGESFTMSFYTTHASNNIFTDGATTAASYFSTKSVVNAGDKGCKLQYDILAVSSQWQSIRATVIQDPADAANVCGQAFRANVQMAVLYDTSALAGHKIRTLTAISAGDVAIKMKIKYSTDSTEEETASLIATNVAATAVSKFGIVPTTVVATVGPLVTGAAGAGAGNIAWTVTFTPTTALVANDIITLGVVQNTGVANQAAVWSNTVAKEDTLWIRTAGADISANCGLTIANGGSWKSITITLTGANCDGSSNLKQLRAGQIATIYIKKTNSVAMRAVANPIYWNIKSSKDLNVVGSAVDKLCGPSTTAVADGMYDVSLRLSKYKTGVAPVKMVIKFKPRTTVAVDKPMIITAGSNIFKNVGNAQVSVTAGITVTGPAGAGCAVQTYLATTSNTIVTIKLNQGAANACTVAKDQEVVVTFDTNTNYLVSNLAAATIAVNVKGTTANLTPNTGLAYTIGATELTSVTVVPNHLTQAVKPDSIIFKFTTATKVMLATKIQFRFASKVFDVDGAATAISVKNAVDAKCKITATVTGGGKRIIFGVVDESAITSGHAFEGVDPAAKCSNADPVIAAGATEIMVTSNLAVNLAAAAVNFDYRSSDDSSQNKEIEFVDKTAAFTTITTKSMRWGGMRMLGAEGTKATSTAGGSREFKFTFASVHPANSWFTITAKIADDAFKTNYGARVWLVPADAAAVAATISPALPSDCTMACAGATSKSAIKCTFSGGSCTGGSAVQPSIEYTLTTSTAAQQNVALPANGKFVRYELDSSVDTEAAVNLPGYVARSVLAPVFTSAVPMDSKQAAAPGKMHITFAPTATLALGDTFTLTSNLALFTASAAGTAVTTTFTDPADGGVASRMHANCAMWCTTPSTKSITCQVRQSGASNVQCVNGLTAATTLMEISTNQAVNPTGAVKFTRSATGSSIISDTAGYTPVNSGKVTPVAVVPNFLGWKRKPTEIVLKFNPAGALVRTSTLTYVFSQAIFAATGATAVADAKSVATLDSKCKITASASSTTTLVITVGDASGVTCVTGFAAGAEHWIKITDNLASNGTVKDKNIRYTVVSSVDLAIQSGNIGYKVVQKAIKAWGSAVLDNFTVAVPTSLTIKFTAASGLSMGNLVKITASANLFSKVGAYAVAADKTKFTTAADADMEAKCGFTAKTTSNAIFVLEITQKTATCTEAFAGGVELKVFIKDAAMPFNINVSGATITFSIVTEISAGVPLDSAISAQTGWIVGSQIATGAVISQNMLSGGSPGTPSKLTIPFKPTTALVTNDLITITSDTAVFAADGKCTALVTDQKASATVAVDGSIPCVVSGSGKIIVVKVAAAVQNVAANSSGYTIDVSTNSGSGGVALKANPKYATAFKFDVKSNKDVRPIAFTGFSTTTKGTVTSVTPDTPDAAAAPTVVVFVLKTYTALGGKGETVSITGTVDWMLATGATTITITAGLHANCIVSAAASSKKILVITVADKDANTVCTTAIAAETSFTVNVKSNLAAWGAAASTNDFSLTTSKDVTKSVVKVFTVAAATMCKGITTALAAKWKASTLPADLKHSTAQIAQWTAKDAEIDPKCKTHYDAAGKIKCGTGKLWEAGSVAPKCTPKVANCDVMATATTCTTCLTTHVLQTPNKQACGVKIRGCTAYKDDNVAHCKTCGVTNFTLGSNTCAATANSCDNAKTATAASWTGAAIPAAGANLDAGAEGATLTTAQFTAVCKTGYTAAGKLLCTAGKWGIGTATCTAKVANCATMVVGSTTDCATCKTNFTLQTGTNAKKACGNGGTGCKADGSKAVVADVGKCMSDGCLSGYKYNAGVCDVIPDITNCKTHVDATKGKCTVCKAGYTVSVDKLKCTLTPKSSAEAISTLLAFGIAFVVAAAN